MKKEIYIPIFVSLLMIATFDFATKFLSLVVIFIPGTVLTYLLYWFKFRKDCNKVDQLLPLYLIALSIQFFHFLEEYLTEFYIEIPELVGLPEISPNAFIIFNMIAYLIFTLGGIILLKRIKVLMVISLFFILVGVFLNTVAHIELSIFTGTYMLGLGCTIYQKKFPDFLGFSFLEKNLKNSTEELNEKLNSHF